MAEGTYGVVFRAEDKKSGEICALKRLKMEKEREGFPITSLREIVTLLKGKEINFSHPKLGLLIHVFLQLNMKM